MSARPYKHTKRSGRTIDVHVLVWESTHGRLPRGYVVHHKNHDKHDNRLENLQLMTHEEHSRHHNDRHPRNRPCDGCGRSYEPDAKHRGRSRTCSDGCFRDLASRTRAGSGNGMAKLSESQVAEIRRRIESGEMQKGLAVQFGVSKMCVSRIARREGWRHVA